MIAVCCGLLSTWMSYADAPALGSDDVKSRCLLATVRILGRNPPESGSGVLLGVKDGFYFALTAEHVVSRSRQLDVVAQSPKGLQKFSDIQILATVAESDLAVIRFPAGDAELATLTLAPKKPELKRFPLPVWTLGWEESEAATSCGDVALKRVLLRQKNDSSAFFWQLANPSTPGRSGGALVTREGRVIGICSGNDSGRGYFSHLDEIDYLLRKHSSCGWLRPEVAKTVKDK